MVIGNTILKPVFGESEISIGGYIAWRDLAIYEVVISINKTTA